MCMLNSYNHIFIIPCSKKKIWTKGHIGPIEAKDAYISTYFRLCKEYVNKFIKLMSSLLPFPTTMALFRGISFTWDFINSV